ncbi:ImmA/IrrE family metallo-endopeptidase [Verrucomicrobiota bacterium]
MKRGFKTEAERLSVGFRQKLGLLPAEALPARRLAEHLQVVLLVPEAIPGIKQGDARLLSRMSTPFSAAVLPVDGRHLIIHNPSHSDARQESDLMHELAHIICGHKATGVDTSLGAPLLAYDRRHEEEANYLGGSLQVPREALMKKLLRGMTRDQIAEFYGASLDLVKYRINITGAERQIMRWRRNQQG